ncbi:MOSC N-terminal beta barrel domain-containing protein [Actinomycetes bacterium KLBMP 9759]
MARVVGLVTYPVKGCAGTPLTEAQLTVAGLAHDRTFMVVDDGYAFRTQRRDPTLAVIRPRIEDGGQILVLDVAGHDPVTVEVDTGGPRHDVRLFNNQYRGIDQGEPVAQWLTAVLGVPSRLVRVPPEHDRVMPGHVPARCGYADSGATLVTSVSSLEELNARIGAEHLPMDRFRANVIVDGWPEAHTEDRARTMTIGNAELGYQKLAIRCAVTRVDQSAGVVAGPEPIRTLASYRRAAEGGVAFGAKFSVLRTGKLAVGDDVTVTRWAESA